ncbi:MAG: phospholipase [Verrucomicrobiales bacterium]|nr:phospholipase [Verrucomicrobiales bacterium]
MKKQINLPRISGVNRRQFLGQTAALAAGLSLGGNPISAAPRNKVLPLPNKSGVDHIVVVMMENRSFDHYLGWLPGADGKQAGLSYVDRNGLVQFTFPLAPDYQGCDHPDPDHSYQGARVEYDNGRCDGWLRAGMNDIYAIGHYNQADLPFLGNAAPGWTTCDHYFAAILAGTYSNRIYQHAAQTDRLDNSLLPISKLPTIWDRLAEHNLKGRYYFSDFPFLALWGTKYLPIARPIDQFYADCAAGTLPQVSFVEPSFVGEEQGLSTDDHPHADIRNGQAFLNRIYEAVTSSPNWASTVMVLNYDEWGGFFDHVPPTRAPIPPADAALGSDGLRGFRVPAVVISPFAQRGYVPHGIYDHTSVLKMIEWRWNLRPLTIRDSTANNLAEVLDFSHRNLAAPRYSVPQGPFGSVCLNQLPGAGEFEGWMDYVAQLGFSSL